MTKTSSVRAEKVRPSWEAYLGEEKDGVEQRQEELDKRKLGWHGLIVPGDGQMLQWLVMRLAVPQIWVVCGLWLLRVLNGLELVVWLCWVLPVLAYGFVCWKSRNSDGGWIMTGGAVIVGGLILGSPGILAVLGI